MLPNIRIAASLLFALAATIIARALRTRTVSFNLRQFTPVDEKFACADEPCIQSSADACGTNHRSHNDVLRRLAERPHGVLSSDFSFTSASWYTDPLSWAAVALTLPLYWVINGEQVFEYTGCDDRRASLGVAYNPLSAFGPLHFVADTYHEADASWLFFEAEIFGGLLSCKPCFSKYFQGENGTIVEERVRGKTMWTFVLVPQKTGPAMTPGSGRFAALNYAMIGATGIDVGSAPTACGGPDMFPHDGSVGDASAWHRSDALDAMKKFPKGSVGYAARQGLLPVYRLLGDAASGNLGGCWGAPEAKTLAGAAATDENVMLFAQFETSCLCSYEPATLSDYAFYFLRESLTAQDRYDALMGRGVWELGPVVGWTIKARIIRAAFKTVEHYWYAAN